MSETAETETRVPIASPAIGDREIERVRDVLATGQLADGPAVRQFEREFADWCDADRGVATTNGTAALHAALRAVGVGDGDRVITTPFSFVATANAIRLCGAEPVFADVDPETFDLDPDAVAAAAAERDVDAILAVHLYGLPAELEALADVADEHDLALVEDAAQAHGAVYRGDPVGSLGDAACFSFYPTKNVTTGEGGIVVTDRDDVARRVRRFVDHGRDADDPHTYVEVGHNFRMTSLAAAIGLEQLQRLPEFVAARRANADRIATAVSGASGVVAPTEPSHVRHSYHQFTVRCDDREAVRAHLADRGVETAVYYPTPIPRQPAYADVDVDVPVADRVAERVVSLPVHPGLSETDLETVVDAVRTLP